MDVSSNPMGCFGLSKVELFGYIRYGYVNDHLFDLATTIV